jgi:hypothetical protein
MSIITFIKKTTKKTTIIALGAILGRVREAMQKLLVASREFPAKKTNKSENVRTA